MASTASPSNKKQALSTNEQKANSQINKDMIKQLEANPHKYGLEIDIDILEIILKQAQNDYYNTDKPLLSDTTFDILENIVITLYIQEKITIQENNLVSSSNNQNRFIPFINNCRNNSDIRRLITDSDIISLPYTYFLIPFNCVLPDIKKKKCSVPEHIYIDDFTNIRTKEKIKSFTKSDS